MNQVGSNAQTPAKPPYVRFETRPIEDRSQSIEAGHVVFKDVVYALITPAGSRDCVEKVAEEWLLGLQPLVEEGRFPLEWLQYYEKAYDAFKRGQEIPLAGTSVKLWPVATPAQVATLLAANLRTVEELAEANEASLRRLGMGARDLQERARVWLRSAAVSGVPTQEMEVLRKSNEDLTERNASLESTVRDMQAKMSQLESLLPQALAQTPAQRPATAGPGMGAFGGK